MLLFPLIWALFASTVLAGFGYVDHGTYWTISTGKNLVVDVSKINGDITSIMFAGVQYQGYTGKNTQVESGLGTSKVTITEFTKPTFIIKVSVKYGTLRHDLVFRYGNDNIYLFTNKEDASVTVHRYIVRMIGGSFSYNTDGSVNSDTDFFPTGSSFIEASDVMALPDGTTWSKHYNGGLYGRIKDFDYVGVSKKGVGIHMVRSNHEKASGGPFFRHLQRRADTGGEDLYDIYYYNMGHTDPERFGLQGPSVLTFTDGSAPNKALYARNADWSWMDGLGIVDWVPASGRGALSGAGLTNMKADLSYTVGLNNADAQYWADAAAGTGAWSITKALPGKYTLTVYKDELEVYTGEATITAGKTTDVDTITCVDPSDTTAIWRIGDWDGTPRGFVNFVDTPWKPTLMHPSDKRLDPWHAGNYIVGTTPDSSFPSYMWTQVNNGHIIYFKLDEDKLNAPHTVRIGITEAFISGRPQITINDWSSDMPAASNQANTRSLTVGTYRGNNAVFEYEVPATAWNVNATTGGDPKVGFNVMVINVISGKSGSGYLSPAISIDCVELI